MQTTTKQFKGKSRILILAVFAALVGANVQPVFAQKAYQALSLADVFGTNVTWLTAVAANGTYLGYTPGGQALLTPNSALPLDTPPGAFDPYSPYYVGINASLATVGSVYLEDDSDTVVFVRQPNDTFRFLSFPSGAMPQPAAINDNGAVVGSYYDQDGNGQGFIADGKGIINTIEIPGGIFVQPTGINTAGVVVGTYVDDQNYNTHNFIMDSKGIREWTLPGSLFAYANCINNNGAIGGWYSDGTNGHGFVVKGDKVSVIDYVNPDAPNYITNNFGGNGTVYVKVSSYPQVNSINDRGDIVGTTVDFYRAADPTLHYGEIINKPFLGYLLP